jgi:bifunctional DNA-binding transcriptional regulator/antitoxin component of YhaV-PrlF toxin-antitoxin module
MLTKQNIEIRKVQGLIGETSFYIVLPKQFAINLGIGKGDFVRIQQNGNKIVIDKMLTDEDKVTGG